MEMPVKEIVLDYLIDRSDRQSVRYTLICQSCGEEWVSTPQSAKEKQFPDKQKTCAAAEAERHFDVCPLCGSLVCNSCMKSVGDMKMCWSCASRMT